MEHLNTDVKSYSVGGFDDKVALLLATLLDIQPCYTLLQSGVRIHQFSLLMGEKCVQYYQQITKKALSQDTRFYILAAMIDQSYINLGKEFKQADLQRIPTLFQYADKTVLYNIQPSKPQSNQQSLFDKLQNTVREQKKQSKSSNNKHSLLKLIQQLQKQYYRQLLTYQRVTHQFDSNQQIARYKKLNPKQLGFIILEKLDRKKKGHIFFMDLLRRITQIDHGILQERVNLELGKQKRRQSQYLITIKNKLCNNVHCDLDNNSRRTKLLKTDLCDFPIHIENIIEMLYRISDKQKSLTYKFITKASKSQLKSYKQKIDKKDKQQENIMHENRKKTMFLAQISHIKDAAHDIVLKNNIVKPPSFGYDCSQPILTLNQYSSQLENRHYRTPSPIKKESTYRATQKQPAEIETYRYVPQYDETLHLTRREQQPSKNKIEQTLSDTHPKIRNMARFADIKQNTQIKDIVEEYQRKVRLNIHQKRQIIPNYHRNHTTKQQIKLRVLQELERISQEKVKNRQRYFNMLGL